MQDVCKLLGVTKLNTTAYHLQCDSMHGGEAEPYTQVYASQDLCQIWSTVGSLCVWCAVGQSKHTPRIHQGEGIVSSLWNRLEITHGSSTTTHSDKPVSVPTSQTIEN